MLDSSLLSDMPIYMNNTTFIPFQIVYSYGLLALYCNDVIEAFTEHVTSGLDREPAELVRNFYTVACTYLAW